MIKNNLSFFYENSLFIYIFVNVILYLSKIKKIEFLKIIDKLYFKQKLK